MAAKLTLHDQDKFMELSSERKQLMEPYNLMLEDLPPPRSIAKSDATVISVWCCRPGIIFSLLRATAKSFPTQSTIIGVFPHERLRTPIKPLH